METLLGLSLFGSYINTKTENPAYGSYGSYALGKNNTVKRKQINGNSVYDATNWRSNKNYVDKIANDRHIAARCPKESGLIPNFYNQFEAVEKRHAVYLNEILKNQKQRDEFILKTQKEDIGKINQMYWNIFVICFVSFIVLTLIVMSM